MKKIVCLTLFGLFFSFLFAQEIPITENSQNAQTKLLPTFLEFDDIPGSYAIYEDSRTDNKTYLGISVYEKNSLLVRTYDSVEKTFSLFFCELELHEKDGALEIVGIAHDALDAQPGEDALSALETVCIMAEHWYKNKEILVDNMQATLEEKAVWQYEYWIPVFQLRSVAQDDIGLELITAGIMDSLIDERFVSFEGLPEVADGTSYTIPTAEKMFPVIDGMQIPLDENWATRDDRFFFIQKDGNPDALFFIQTFDFSVFGTDNIKEIIRQQLRNLKSVLFAQGTRVFELPDGTVNVFLRSYNSEAKQAVVEQYQYFSRNQTRFSIATLSCFETMYLANKEYFDKIIY